MASGTKRHTNWHYQGNVPMVEASSRPAGGFLVNFSRLLSVVIFGARPFFLEKFDAIICPVNASPALPHHTTYDGDNICRFSYAQLIT
jgi:hypothetical protein